MPLRGSTAKLKGDEPMSEEESVKGRKKGSEKESGCIMVNDKLRIRVEADNLIIDQSTGNDIWGNSRFFQSWDSVLNWLIRRFTTEKISKKKIWAWKEAKKEILIATNEVKEILMSGIQEQIESSSEEIKGFVKHY